MSLHCPGGARRSRIEAIVPSLAGWRTYPRAVANLLVFGMAVLGGEWLVHQLEYLIEYGDRFGAVMASTPHRFYMARLGALLTVAVVVLLTLVLVRLCLGYVEQRRLVRLLPPRLARHVPAFASGLPVWAVTRTALVLAGCQAALYLLQENLERAAVYQEWPGLSVLLAPSHATVIPLHLLVALGGSWLLWTASTRIRRSRQAVHVAQVLAAMLAPQTTPAPRLVPIQLLVPNLRLIAGVLCLRSPPLPA